MTESVTLPCCVDDAPLVNVASLLYHQTAHIRKQHSTLWSFSSEHNLSSFFQLYCCFYMCCFQFNLFGSFPPHWPHSFSTSGSPSSITSALLAIIMVLILTNEELHQLQMALNEKQLFKGAGFNLVTATEGNSVFVVWGKKVLLIPSLVWKFKPVSASSHHYRIIKLLFTHFVNGAWKWQSKGKSIWWQKKNTQNYCVFVVYIDSEGDERGEHFPDLQ